MKRKTLAAIAALTTGVGAALASGFGTGDPLAEYDTINRINLVDITQHARTTFARADLDKNNALDVDEFASLTVVKAELARLNGYVAIELDDGPRLITVAVEAFSSLGRGERLLIDTVARSKFYSITGGADLMKEDQYVGERMASFVDADRNRDGDLIKAELERFVALGANISTAGV